MYQLVIFDWDGTLMDSTQKIANCIQASARDLEIIEPGDKEAKNIIGLGLHEAMQQLFPEQVNSIHEQLVERYKYHFVTGDNTAQALFDGVLEGLKALNESGALLAVATGKSRAGLDRVLSGLELESEFTVTRCADETRNKPNPQMLEEILAFTSIAPEKAVMVGDTTYDILMSQHAGIDGLGVSYGVHEEAELRSEGAKHVVHSSRELFDWLLAERVEKAFSN